MSNNTHIYMDLHGDGQNSLMKSLQSFSPSLDCVVLEGTPIQPLFLNVKSMETFNGCDNVYKAPFNLLPSTAFGLE